MPRMLIVLLGVVAAGLLGASPVTANTEVVRLADPTLATNVSAVTQFNNVYMQPVGNSSLQRWQIVRETADAVKFINAGTGGCLTVFNRFGDIEGNIADQEHCLSGWTWQQWRVDNRTNGTVRLVNVGTNKCLTVTTHSSNEGLAVLMYTCGTQPRQDFRVISST